MAREVERVVITWFQVSERPCRDSEPQIARCHRCVCVCVNGLCYYIGLLYCPKYNPDYKVTHSPCLPYSNSYFWKNTF